MQKSAAVQARSVFSRGINIRLSFIIFLQSPIPVFYRTDSVYAFKGFVKIAVIIESSLLCRFRDRNICLQILHSQIKPLLFDVVINRFIHHAPECRTNIRDTIIGLLCQLRQCNVFTQMLLNILNNNRYSLHTF